MPNAIPLTGEEQTVLTTIRTESSTSSRDQKEAAFWQRTGQGRQRNEKFDDARKCYERALTITSTVLGSLHPLTRMNAVLLLGLQRPTTAAQTKEVEDSYLSTLAQLETATLGSSDERSRVRAATLSLLGNFYSDLGRFSEASLHLGRAVELSRALYGPTHADVVMNLNSLALVYAQQPQMLQRAEELFTDALELGRQSGNEKSSLAAGVTDNLGQLQRSRGNLAGAEATFRTALQLRLSTLGAQHPHTQLTQHKLATLLLERSNFAEAETMLLDSLTKANPATSPRLVAATLDSLARVYMETNRPEKAASRFKESLDVKTQALGGSHPETALALRNLGFFSFNTGDALKAKEYLTAAVAAFTATAEGRLSPHARRTLLDFGLMLEAFGEKAEAVAVLERALGLFGQGPGKADPDTEQISALIQKLKKPS